jgi:hypothetical protein
VETKKIVTLPCSTMVSLYSVGRNALNKENNIFEFVNANVIKTIKKRSMYNCG